jgi:hypothetical protein
MQNQNTLGSALSAIGTYSQINAISKSSQQQINAANQNSAYAQSQAYAVGQAGAAQMNQLREKGTQTMASQTAAMAANGLDTGSGTAVANVASTAGQNAQDIANTRYNTVTQMWGLNQQAVDYRQQASNIASQADNSKLSTVLTAASKASQQYSSYNSALGGTGQANKSKNATSYPYTWSGFNTNT